MPELDGEEATRDPGKGRREVMAGRGSSLAELCRHPECAERPTPSSPRYSQIQDEYDRVRECLSAARPE
jgi:hypothetical protein